MKKASLKWICIVSCVFIFMSMMGCGPSIKQSESGKTYYTKYNFHYTTEKGKIRGSVANLTKLPEHKILPYGSPVEIRPWSGGFVMIDKNSGRKIEVLSKKKWLAGKSLSEYLDLILSTNPVSYTGLSEIDKKGISDGKPYKGMTKKGVMIALGYPCPHATPSPSSDVWQYWENRFGNYRILFENDVVVSSGH